MAFKDFPEAEVQEVCSVPEPGVFELDKELAFSEENHEKFLDGLVTQSVSLHQTH